jgi:hypothetical protein
MNVKSDIDKLINKFDKADRQLINTSRKLRDEIGRQLIKDIEQDIRGSLQVRVAEVPRAFNYNNGTLTLRGGFYKEVIPQHYNSGIRLHTPFEKALISKGWMSDNSYAIPVRPLKRRKYREVLQRANSNRSDMFVIKHTDTNRLKSGIYQRKGKRLEMLFYFTESKGRYKKRLDLNKRVIATTKKILKDFKIGL